MTAPFKTPGRHAARYWRNASQSPDIAVHSHLPGCGRIRELEANHNLLFLKKVRRHLY